MKAVYIKIVKSPKHTPPSIPRPYLEAVEGGDGVADGAISPLNSPVRFEILGWRLVRALLLRAGELPKFGDNMGADIVRRLTIADAWRIRCMWRSTRRGTWIRKNGNYRRRS